MLSKTPVSYLEFCFELFNDLVSIKKKFLKSYNCNIVKILCGHSNVWVIAQQTSDAV